jgi:integrase
MREWHARYRRWPSSYDWSRTHGRRRGGETLERLNAGDWPSASVLIAALPETEQAFWALALFAGVRRGELRGLQVDDIDFDAGLVRVRRGWDDLEGEIDPKTFAGARDIPMIGELRRICRAHRLQTGRHDTQLFLGRTPADPFYPSTIRRRALKAWGWKQMRADERRAFIDTNGACQLCLDSSIVVDFVERDVIVGEVDVDVAQLGIQRLSREDLFEYGGRSVHRACRCPRTCEREQPVALPEALHGRVEGVVSCLAALGSTSSCGGAAGWPSR